MAQNIVVVASHKQYPMPPWTDTYTPVEVGSASRTEHLNGYQRDDQGQSISEKNSSYCELTALYWAWKNTTSDSLGLVHYRRHFCEGHWTGLSSVPSGERLSELLASFELIVPKPRRYFIETTYSHYIHSHFRSPIDALSMIMMEQWPEYAGPWSEVLSRREAHMFNMFVGRRNIADGYAKWLFAVLAEVEKRVDIEGWDPVEQRVYGYLSELLLDTWILRNSVSYVELPIHHLEGEQWHRKVPRFLWRKARAAVADVEPHDGLLLK